VNSGCHWTIWKTDVIEDLAEQVPGEALQFDICLVGAGPAGITIATELSGRGIKVCLAESGGRSEEADTQALYQGECVGHPMPLDVGRYRVFGGSATRWGGRSAMLDPIDFEHRGWVEKSGWPVSFTALASYYYRAKCASNFKRPWIADHDVPGTLGVRLPGFQTGAVVPFIWRVASPDFKKTPLAYVTPGYRKAFNWGLAYNEKLRRDPDTLVLLHANVVAIQEGEDGAGVGAVTLASLNGCQVDVKAKIFVLCCGGIENARLLLHAPRPVQARLNAFDNVGRYLSQHPRGRISHIRTSRADSNWLQQTFNVFPRPRCADVQYEIGLALSERAQREHQLLNASVAFYYEALEETSWKAGQRLQQALASRRMYTGMRRDAGTLLTNAWADTPNLMRKFVIGSRLILKNPRISAVIDLEQEPNRESRITLSSKRDRLGMQQARVDWKIGELERRTALYFSRFLTQELRRLGLDQVEEAAWLTKRTPLCEGDLAGNYHHIGTTRMSESPRDGVVDQNCRVHGIANLYAVGTSVFPTGGHANPTLTIVALSIRLADHIREQLKRQTTVTQPSEQRDRSHHHSTSLV
jgi:choline dehydrogenase-like flavoprotein